MANETSSQLATAFQPAQSRMPTISTNPVGLSANLTQQAQELQEIDFQGEASTAISNLEAEAAEYEANEGKVNQPLVDARNAVVLLTVQLDEAKRNLAAIEAKGTWLDKFNNSVLDAERMVAVLVRQYERLVTNQLVESRFGQIVTVPREVLKELRFHARVTNLKRFHIAAGYNVHEQVTPERLFARAEKAAKTLDALRQYISKDQADNAKK
jgi:hypothetical protein